MSIELALLLEKSGKKNLTRKQILELRPPKDYGPGRTKQSFKDSTDINKMLAKQWKAGTLSHLENFEGVYGDFSDFDFQTAQNQLARGKSIFMELPAEIRKEFDQDPSAFFAYVNDPANKDDLRTKLPALAAPGRQRVQLFGDPETVSPAVSAELSSGASSTPEASAVEAAAVPAADSSGGPPPDSGDTA